MITFLVAKPNANTVNLNVHVMVRCTTRGYITKETGWPTKYKGTGQDMLLIKKSITDMVTYRALNTLTYIRNRRMIFICASLNTTDSARARCMHLRQ